MRTETYTVKRPVRETTYKTVNYTVRRPVTEQRPAHGQLHRQATCYRKALEGSHDLYVRRAVKENKQRTVHYTVRKPVTETTMKTVTSHVRKKVSETKMRTVTSIKRVPYTEMKTVKVRGGHFETRTEVIPGRSYTKIKRTRGSFSTDPCTGCRTYTPGCCTRFAASDLTERFAVRSGFLNAQQSKLLYASTVAKRSARKFLTLFAKSFASQ